MFGDNMWLCGNSAITPCNSPRLPVARGEGGLKILLHSSRSKAMHYAPKNRTEFSKTEWHTQPKMQSSSIFPEYSKFVDNYPLSPNNVHPFCL